MAAIPAEGWRKYERLGRSDQFPPRRFGEGREPVLVRPAVPRQGPGRAGPGGRAVRLRCAAERARLEAERQRQQAEAKAQAEKEAAVREAERKVREEADRREKERLAAEEAERKEQQRLAADTEHRDEIELDAIASLVNEGMASNVSKRLIKLISEGKVKHVTINY